MEMITFFKNTLYARDYRKKASEQCSKFSGKLAKIFLVYLIVYLLIFIIFNVRIDKSYVHNGETANGIFEYVGFTIYIIPNIYYSLISLIMSIPLPYSFIIIAKKVYYKEEPQFKDLLSGFKKFIRVFLLMLLQMVYVFLWTLLLIIPGIIKTFSYSMALYIAIDNPELSVNQCISRSKKIMSGYKWNYFCLAFSYLGWILLSILTLGILLLWVMPKMQQANYLFYLKVSRKGLEIENEKLKESNSDLK